MASESSLAIAAAASAPVLCRRLLTPRNRFQGLAAPSQWSFRGPPDPRPWFFPIRSGRPAARAAGPPSDQRRARGQCAAAATSGPVRAPGPKWCRGPAACWPRRAILGSSRSEVLLRLCRGEGEGSGVRSPTCRPGCPHRLEARILLGAALHGSSGVAAASGCH